jgi:hypothetical protein
MRADNQACSWGNPLKGSQVIPALLFAEKTALARFPPREEKAEQPKPDAPPTPCFEAVR